MSLSVCLFPPPPPPPLYLGLSFNLRVVDTSMLHTFTTVLINIVQMAVLYVHALQKNGMNIQSRYQKMCDTPFG